MLEKGWKELPLRGLIITPGCSIDYHTGTWRALRPTKDMEKCVHCMLCWLLCPDSAVAVKNSKAIGFDLHHCKGCGICAEECPRQAITMVEEAVARKESQ